MSIQYIRDYYKVPAKVGDEVIAVGSVGRIIGTRGQYLRIRLHCNDSVGTYHPTWGIEYTAAQDSEVTE